MEQLSIIKEAIKEVSNKTQKNFISEIKEKVALYGTESLSNRELVMVLVNDMEKANLVCKEGLTAIEEMSLQELKNIISETKAIQIKVSLELSKRIRNYKREEIKISNPKDIADMLMDELRFLKQEVLVVVFLNTKNVVIGKEIVFKGSLNSSVVHPREVFSEAIKRNCASIIVAHNHPSGDPTPSGEDNNVTIRLKECGKIVGIDLLDHVIIGEGKYVSLKEKGII